ncbi:PDGLE domain-containing protein [Paenibacillus alkalitolerans]|uniref:PDGLE domain-containing protein n=1 Tax=Paenibacillus alkalitolerans TaxID=2799335 RepID=UPI0018F428CF|nr:PDGLE domain-containing protein [Paenibacillus alkalitolerans]
MIRDKRKLAVLAVVVFGILLFLAPFASEHPDGLERVAEDEGFQDISRSYWIFAPFANYRLDWIPMRPEAAVSAAGAIGIAVIMGTIRALGMINLHKQRGNKS